MEFAESYTNNLLKFILSVPKADGKGEEMRPPDDHIASKPVLTMSDGVKSGTFELSLLLEHRRQMGLSVFGCPLTTMPVKDCEAAIIVCFSEIFLRQVL